MKLTSSVNEWNYCFAIIFTKKISMAIQLLVCDLAGTTVHDNRDVHRILQQTLERHGVTISLDDANEVMGIPKPNAIKALLQKQYTGNRPITSQWTDEIHRDFVSSMIAFYKTDPSVAEKPGVSEVFRKVKEKKIKIAIDTGFDRQITDPLLERMGWQKNRLIDASVTSDEVERGRPYPHMIFRAMMLTGVSDAEQVAKVGDTISDLQEGNAAGCKLVIGITTGAFTRDQLMKEYHTHLIEELDELVDIILAQ
jgi:phosphonatase-like hydrolase